jgi:hypothetical protein
MVSRATESFSLAERGLGMACWGAGSNGVGGKSRVGGEAAWGGGEPEGGKDAYGRSKARIHNKRPRSAKKAHF